MLREAIRAGSKKSKSLSDSCVPIGLNVFTFVSLTTELNFYFINVATKKFIYVKHYKMGASYWRLMEVRRSSSPLLGALILSLTMMQVSSDLQFCLSF